MTTWIRSLAAAAVVLGFLSATGCARRPKLDLTGLRGSAPGGGEGVAGAGADFGGGLGEFKPFVGTEALGPSGGGWTATDQPLTDGSGGGIVPTQERWASVVVYFAYDSAAIGPAERPKLETLAGHLKEYANYAVIVEGHCDDRGSDEYNRALGEQRALVVRDYLMSLGITGDRLETVSYGEERPAVPNATSESQHGRNRRAEFVIGTRR
ncbi:MAG: OmpA family protein [Lentisphaeria bacterium]|nr:OmpA family protein [Lentisphaeria bacterium]